MKEQERQLRAEVRELLARRGDGRCGRCAYGVDCGRRLPQSCSGARAGLRRFARRTGAGGARAATGGEGWQAAQKCNRRSRGQDHTISRSGVALMKGSDVWCKATRAGGSGASLQLIVGQSVTRRPTITATTMVQVIEHRATATRLLATVAIVRRKLAYLAATPADRHHAIRDASEADDTQPCAPDVTACDAGRR